MARGPGKLRGTTKPDGDHVWNSFGAIGSSVVYLELQIGDRLESLDPQNVLAWEDDEGQERWWCMRSGRWWTQSRVHLWSEY